jgi:hypothetical protein
MLRIAFAAALLLIATPALADVPPTWVYKELGAAPDGSKYFVAQIRSTADLAGAFGKPEKASFQVRCDAKGLFVTLFWPDFLTAETYDGDHSDIVWRVDGGKPRTVKMKHTDQAALALGRDGFRLLRQIAGAKTLTVDADDRHGGQEAVFQVEGLQGLYDRVKAQGCT